MPMRIDSPPSTAVASADTAVIQASENLNAGDFVNVWNNSGNARVRQARADAFGKEAHGFVLSAVTTGNNATVYFEGSNTACSGMIPGTIFLSATPGLGTFVPPTGAGLVVQRIGFAVSSTTVNFQSEEPIGLSS